MLAAVERMRSALPPNVVSTCGVSTIVATTSTTRLSTIDMARAKLRDIHLRHWAGALWAGFRTRPWILRVPLNHAPVGPNQLAWLDRLLQPLLAAGLAGGEARAAALHLTAVVRGTAQLGLALTAPRGGADLAETLGDLLDPRAYPALTAVHAAEAAGDRLAGGRSEEALPVELGFGVDRFLDGVEAWVAAKGAGS
jgi:hypothetical protein